MHAFALLVRQSQIPAHEAAEVAALGKIAGAEAEPDHEVVHSAGGDVDSVVLVEGWAGGVAVARQRGDDNMVGQVLRAVAGAEEVEEVVEFEDTAWPAVVEGDGDGVFFLGEEG